MAFKLSKAEIKTRDEFVSKLEIESGKLAEAIETYNAAVAEAKIDLQDAVDTYNEIVQDAQYFITEIAEAKRGEYDDKSERWKEGEAGELASEFVDVWEGIEMEPIDLDIPGDIDQPEPSHRDDLEGLPEAAS